MTDIERFELGNNIGAAYAFVGRNLGLIAILFVVWAIVIGVIGFGGVVAIRLAIGAIPDLAAATADIPDETLSLISLIPMVIASVVALSAVIVTWHRRIITGVVARNPFSVGFDPTLRYLACAIVVFGLAFAPLVLAGATAALLLPKSADMPGGPAIVVIGIVVLAVGATLLTMRLSLLFPAIAVGDRTMTLARSWDLTKHNTWRLFWGSFVCALPFSMVGNVIDNVLKVQGLAETVPGLVLAFFGAAAELLGYITVAAFISLAYIQLTGLDGAVDRPPASHFS